MDTNDLKGRIAETLVEGILRRAGYRVALTGRESRVRNLLKVGGNGFMPALLAWKPTEDGRAGTPRLVALEVTYRADVESALRQDVPSLREPAAQWQNLYFVFVTEHPERGRSCFQAADARSGPAGAPWQTVDLHEVADLDIYWHTVEEYERLVKMVFPILSGAARARVATRLPAQRLPGRITAVRVSR